MAGGIDNSLQFKSKDGIGVMEYIAPDMVLRTLLLLGRLFAWWYERKGKVNQLELRNATCERQLASTQRLAALLGVALFVVIFVHLRMRHQFCVGK